MWAPMSHGWGVPIPYCAPLRVLRTSLHFASYHHPACPAPVNCSSWFSLITAAFSAVLPQWRPENSVRKLELEKVKTTIRTKPEAFNIICHCIWSPSYIHMQFLSLFLVWPLAGAHSSWMYSSFFFQAHLLRIWEHSSHYPSHLLWSAYLSLLSNFLLVFCLLVCKKEMSEILESPYHQSKTINLYSANNEEKEM